MEQSPSWEADNSSGNQEIPHIFLEPECSLRRSHDPATCPYSESE